MDGLREDGGRSGATGQAEINCQVPATGKCRMVLDAVCSYELTEDLAIIFSVVTICIISLFTLGPEVSKDVTLTAVGGLFGAWKGRRTGGGN